MAAIDISSARARPRNSLIGPDVIQRLVKLADFAFLIALGFAAFINLDVYTNIYRFTVVAFTVPFTAFLALYATRGFWLYTIRALSDRWGNEWNRFVDAARSAGVRLDTEIGLFVRACRGRITGVTGTAGKSTTPFWPRTTPRASGATPGVRNRVWCRAARSSTGRP